MPYQKINEYIIDNNVFSYQNQSERMNVRCRAKSPKVKDGTNQIR